MLKRLALATALIGTLTMISTPAQAHPGITWAQRQTRDRFQTVDAGPWTTHENVLTITAAADIFGVSPSVMLCIAHNESGALLDEHAYNSSSASGLFQHIASYWPGRVSAYNFAMRHRPWLQVHYDVFQSRANSLVSAWMMSHSFSPWAPDSWCWS